MSDVVLEDAIGDFAFEEVATLIAIPDEISYGRQKKGKRGVCAACTRGTCAMKMCAWWISTSRRCPAAVVGVRRSGG